MGDAIQVVEEAFADYARGDSLLLPRAAHTLPGTAGALRIISAALPSSSFFGLKTLTGSPGKRLSDETYFVILLFDMETGALRAAISANHLTGLRTGAASAVAAKYLARPDSEVLGVFGAGPQARYQVEALCAIRPVRLVKVFTPHIQSATSFAGAISRDFGVEAHAVESSREAVSGCDLIAAATTSREPVFDGHWLEEGTHISGAGSNAPAKRELDAECFRRSTLVVDIRSQAMEEAGDLRSAIENHVIGDGDAPVELGEIVVGKKPGRRSEGEITLFKSIGIAIEDVASAVFVYHRARALGLGTELESYAGLEGSLKH
jgi:ornithine cyclodeaminase/alanine dehydrogenase-like protein (mu-crystallin family)